MYLENGKKIIRDYVDKGLLPGAVFACVFKDSFEKDYYGYKSLIPIKEETSLNTLYDIASLSKVVSTSIMIFKLIEEGLISLDTKVKDIIKEYPYDDVTIKHLLVHTSGMIADDKRYKDCKNKEELWNFMIHDLKRECGIDEKVIYSCFGYIVLGKIIEHYKGSLEDYLYETLCKPLDTKDILYRPDKYGRKDECASTEYNPERGVIKGVVHDGKCNIMNGVSGNAGIFANIDSLIKYTQMILNDGIYNGKRVLEKSTIDKLKKVYTPNLNENRTIGSWFMGDKNQSSGDYVSDLSLYHTGFTGTSMYIDFKRECGIILLTNVVHLGRDHKMNEIRKLFHNEILKNIQYEHN